MQTLRNCFFILILVLWAGIAYADQSHLLVIKPGADRWEASTKGPYDVALDIRDLYQVMAFWEISEAGNYGQISTKVTIPSDWVRPYMLRIFLADDYEGWGIDRSQSASWWVESTFIGHRFKQVLVDDRLVWEQDVADTGTGQYYDIDLSWAVEAGQTFQLTLRMADRVPSDQELPGDYHRIGESTVKKPSFDEPTTYHRFETRSYWGDLVLYDGMATQEEVAASCGFDWLRDAKPLGAAERGMVGVPAEGPLRLRLETDGASKLPSIGYPVSSGVPFAEGMLQPGSPIQLRDPLGHTIPVQTTVLSKWKDGSVKWLLLDFVAYPDCAEKQYSVVWQRPKPAPTPTDLKAYEAKDGIHVEGGGVRFTVPRKPGPELLTDIATARREAISSIGGVLDCRTQDAEEKQPPGKSVHYIATREQAWLESAGPMVATVRIDGRLLDAEGAALGNFVMRVSAYAGLPYLHVFYRVFNGSAEHRRLDLSQLTLHSAGGKAVWAGMPEMVCHFADAKTPGPDGTLAQDGFGIGARQFWQQFPKAILPKDDALQINLYDPIEADSVHNWFAIGEAKRHELLLTFADNGEENKLALGTFEVPPRLFDKVWQCQSGGWGLATYRDSKQFPEFQEMLMNYWKGWRGIDTFGREYGSRNFGDTHYADGWFNNYYDLAYACFAEYLMGGDRWNFERGEAMVRHLMDVDQIHLNDADLATGGQTAGKLWNAYPQLHHNSLVGPSTGALHTFGTAKNHNLTGPLDSKTFSTRSYLAYYHLTGDLDALEAALSLGDYVARSGAGHGERSARAQSFPLNSLMTTYEETYDPDVLATAGLLVADVMTFGKRRGAYVEPFLSREYLANGGGMVTDLTGGLMHYWLATKDKSAAVAVVALASAVLAENSGGPHAMPCYWKREAGSTVLLPPGQGERGTVGVTHYSGSPFQKNWAPEYVHMVCPAFVYAYDLTGKHEFLEAARGGYAEAARTNYLGNMPCYWDAPVLLYYLETFEPQ